MQGLHLTADLRGCAAGRPEMIETASLRSCCLAAVARAGLTPVGELFHRFVPAAAPGAQPCGITGVVLLAESHLAVHTWPELGVVTLDLYVCHRHADNSARAEAALAALLAGFAAAEARVQRVRRGPP